VKFFFLGPGKSESKNKTPGTAQLDETTFLPLTGKLLEITEARLMSRLLYTNPVCLLSTCIPQVVSDLEDGVKWSRNVMVASWLSPCNNEGMFVMCINNRRFSARCLLERKTFVLSVPVAGQEDMVIAIGSQTGKNVDKFDSIGGLKAVRVGESDDDGDRKGKAAVSTKDAAPGGNPFALLDSESHDDGEEQHKCGCAWRDCS
jgi:hypothetical protein